MLTKNNNTYNKHSDSQIKDKCRTKIVSYIMRMFPLAETLHTFTLGGEEMMMEKKLSNFFKLNGVSYEFKPNSCVIAKRNAPSGIKVIEGNIFDHVYKGIEQFIWFDFMTVLRYENVNLLLKWLTINQITNDCVFAVTYTLHSREAGNGYKQLFDTDDEHETFIQEMAYYIGNSLENEYVKQIGNIDIIKYCNTDVSKGSLPMVQFIFNLKRR